MPGFTTVLALLEITCSQGGTAAASAFDFSSDSEDGAVKGGSESDSVSSFSDESVFDLEERGGSALPRHATPHSFFSGVALTALPLEECCIYCTGATGTAVFAAIDAVVAENAASRAKASSSVAFAPQPGALRATSARSCSVSVNFETPFPRVTF